VNTGVLTIRLATREDDAQVRAVLRRNIMPGMMTLAFTHEPSFFDAVEVEGDDPRVIAGAMDGQVVGVGLLAARRIFLNGEAAEIGYLSSLRIDQSQRGTTALARGYRFFKRLHRERPLPFYLSTIMEENTAAREMLTSGRAGLPAYHAVGRYRTLAIPLMRRKRKKLPARLRLVSGSAVGAEAIAAFLRDSGRSRQFYPVYTAVDLLSPTGLLRGLALDDFTVALSGDAIAGTLACWNQLPFRQHLVTGYHGAMKWWRPALNLAAAPLGCQLLPPPRAPVRCLLAACLAIREDDPNIFRALLGEMLSMRAGADHDYLFVGLAEGDPLLPVAVEPLHLTLRSRIYAVAWDAAPALDGRAPYLELGSL